VPEMSFVIRPRRASRRFSFPHLRKR
jgi:hypothetical protein